MPFFLAVKFSSQNLSSKPYPALYTTTIGIALKSQHAIYKLSRGWRSTYSRRPKERKRHVLKQRGRTQVWGRLGCSGAPAAHLVRVNSDPAKVQTARSSERANVECRVTSLKISAPSALIASGVAVWERWHVCWTCTWCKHKHNTYSQRGRGRAHETLLFEGTFINFGLKHKWYT